MDTGMDAVHELEPGAGNCYWICVGYSNRGHICRWVYRVMCRLLDRGTHMSMDISSDVSGYWKGKHICR